MVYHKRYIIIWYHHHQSYCHNLVIGNLLTDEMMTVQYEDGNDDAELVEHDSEKYHSLHHTKQKTRG